MIFLAALAAGCAAFCLVGSFRVNPVRQAARLAAVPIASESDSRSSRRGILVSALGAAAVLIAATATLFGSAGAVVVAAFLLISATAARLVANELARRRAVKVRAEIAHACQTLARLVGVGHTPEQALAVASEDAPVLAEGVATSRLGGDPLTTWRMQSAQPGYEGLLVLARAWQVSRSSGCGLSGPVKDAADSVQSNTRLRNQVESELAAPKATGRMLAVLPIFGVAIGFFIGGNPLEFMLTHPVGQASLLAGVALACGGCLWVERLTSQGATARRKTKPSPPERPTALSANARTQVGTSS